MQTIDAILRWFTGGSNQYMTLYHCMSHDVLWISITVMLDLTVAAGYLLIAKHWWQNQKRLAATPATNALRNMRNIFIFCGICGYVFIPIKMVWPAWRLYDLFLVVLAYYTWRYAWGAKDLKVIYTELGRSGQLAADLERSRQESRRKSDFLNALSHDLRTPLNAVALHAQVARLAAENNDPQAIHRAVTEIEVNAQATAELLNSLLQCARLDWTDEPVTARNFALDELLEEVVGGCRPLAEHKGLELRVSAPGGVILGTDRHKLERIAMNLLSNAIKFTDKGYIKVVAECASDALEMHVIDTGIGLSSEQQARLFEEFYQAGNNERDRRKGFGLGLAISRRLARQLGGDIEVHSAPGKGSRFTLLLPGVARGVGLVRHERAACAQEFSPAGEEATALGGG